MYVYLQAYESAAAPEPVVAFVTFYRGRAKVFETPPLQVSSCCKAASKLAAEVQPVAGQAAARPLQLPDLGGQSRGAEGGILAGADYAGAVEGAGERTGQRVGTYAMIEAMATVRITEAELARDIHAMLAQVRKASK